MMIDEREQPRSSDSLEAGALRVCCVIPAYRAFGTVVDVVRGVLPYVDDVVVIDDACPEASGEAVRASFGNEPNVCVFTRTENGGVGAATKSGIELALQRGADIVVKVDADGQMDPAFIAEIRALFLEKPALAYVKGNRFFDVGILQLMPKIRLFGNAVLSLLSKWASGYWNIIDPTNGYIAFNAAVLRAFDWRSFADSYFFELSILCELGLRGLPIVELEMPTIYTAAPSSLSLSRVAFEFPPRLFRRMVRRMVLQYFVYDVNLGSIYFALGALLAIFALCFGGYEWTQSILSGVPRATGTIMLAVLPFLMGFQLLLNALMYDVQFSQRTEHVRKVHRVHL